MNDDVSGSEKNCTPLIFKEQGSGTNPEGGGFPTGDFLEPEGLELKILRATTVAGATYQKFW